jgi:hypothetical protein
MERRTFLKRIFTRTRWHRSHACFTVPSFRISLIQFLARAFTVWLEALIKVTADDFYAPYYG